MDIPDVFPEDHGDIPKQVSVFEKMAKYIQFEIENKGLVNVLLMQGDDGKINYGAVGLIYFTIIFTFATMCFVLRDSA